MSEYARVKHEKITIKIETGDTDIPLLLCISLAYSNNLCHDYSHAFKFEFKREFALEKYFVTDESNHSQ